MGRPRAFDHDEARARWARGENGPQIAAALGVSGQSVYRVVNPAYGKRAAKATRARLEAGRVPCRGGCGVLVWPYGPARTGYCRACYGDRRRVVAHGTEKEYVKWRCRCEACTTAAREARRRRRDATKVPCVHCGTPVDSQNRRAPGKPFECPPCSGAHRRSRPVRSVPAVR